MSKFRHLGTGYLLQFALACSRFLSGMAREALLRVHVLPLLLFWDFYQCPRTLALASACLRCRTLTHLLVHSLWGYLCFHSMAPQNLLVLEDISTVAARSFLKSLLLFSLWFFLILCFSCLSILDQAGKSVPNFLELGGDWLWRLSICIGAIQAVLGIFVVPWVASKLTRHARAFTTVASLCMSCFFPAAVVVCLDVRCFGGWALLWNQCRTNAGAFEVAFKLPGGTGYVKALQASDICSLGQSSLSLSTCASTALLRLQDVWLSKFVSSALAVPAVKVMASRYITDSNEVVGHFAMLFAFAVMTSGHLPLVMPLLYVSALSQTVLAAISWAKSSMRHQRVRDPVVLRERERDRLGGRFGCFLFLMFKGREPQPLTLGAFQIPGVGCPKPLVLLFLSWKSGFSYRHRPEGIFSTSSLGLILAPPPGRYTCFYSEKGKFFGSGYFFPFAWPF